MCFYKLWTFLYNTTIIRNFGNNFHFWGFVCSKGAFVPCNVGKPKPVASMPNIERARQAQREGKEKVAGLLTNKTHRVRADHRPNQLSRPPHPANRWPLLETTISAPKPGHAKNNGRRDGPNGGWRDNRILQEPLELSSSHRAETRRRTPILCGLSKT